jgi:hypothetical protein
MAASLHPITRTVLRVQLTIRADFEWRERGHGQALRWLILVEDSANEHIYHSEVRVCMRMHAFWLCCRCVLEKGLGMCLHSFDHL